MAKRFIDTKIFKDNWVFELSKDAKLLYIYLLTNCDHAGIIEFNEKIIDFETNIKSSARVRQELGKSLIHLRDNYFFLCKFPKFQYGDFSEENSNIKKSVVKRLKEFDLLDENLRVKQELGNSWATVMVKDKDKDNKGGCGGKNKNETNLNFIENEKIKEIFKKWIDYKKERGQTYKSIGLKTAYNKLIEYSNQDPLIAEKIIDNAISNNYAGFFPLKENNFNKSKGVQVSDNKYANVEVINASDEQKD